MAIMFTINLKEKSCLMIDLRKGWDAAQINGNNSEKLDDQCRSLGVDGCRAFVDNPYSCKAEAKVDRL